MHQCLRVSQHGTPFGSGANRNLRENLLSPTVFSVRKMEGFLNLIYGFFGGGFPLT